MTRLQRTPRALFRADKTLNCQSKQKTAMVVLHFERIANGKTNGLRGEDEEGPDIAVQVPVASGPAALSLQDAVSRCNDALWALESTDFNG